MAKKTIQVMDDEVRAVVPIEPEVTSVAPVVRRGRMIPTMDTPLSACPTNIDISTDGGKAMMMAAGNPCDIQFGSDGVATIVATHYLIYPTERVDEDTGELSQYCCTVLFDSQGRTLRTTAAHAPHRIAAACDLWGPDDWASGITFTIRQRMGKMGRTYHDIRAAKVGG